MPMLHGYLGTTAGGDRRGAARGSPDGAGSGCGGPDRTATPERATRPMEHLARRQPAHGALRHRLTGDLTQTPSAFVVLAGLWLTCTPLFAGSTEGYPWGNDTGTGLMIATLATIRVARPGRTARLSVVNIVLGGWLITAPFVLGFTQLLGVAWNDMIVGVLVMMLAGTSAIAGAGEPHSRR
ncbi:SPW repeat protein [Actinoplanes sp. NPDC026619]|uniref:SPW repeat protein n=1 Tax=Actinoplanes sp. NPDC026619 TaxID=3155798 RepID=UPI0033E57962